MNDSWAFINVAIYAYMPLKAAEKYWVPNEFIKILRFIKEILDLCVPQKTGTH